MLAFVLITGLLTTSSDSVHVVQRGETLYSISKTYSITVPQLQEWNRLSDTRLTIGAELRVIPPRSSVETTAISSPEMPQKQVSVYDFPSGSETLKAEPEDRSVTYTVRSGDTLYGLSQRFNVPIGAIRSLNRLSGDQLSVGQVLILRRERITPSVVEELPENRPQGLFHVYQMGSTLTLSQVLRRFSMDETEFKALNPGVDPSTVKAGQEILVLLPADRRFENPYAQLGSTGQKESISVTLYSSAERATPTSSGELVNPTAFTAGHSTYPLGTLLLLENPANGLSVLVRVNDRIRGTGLKITPASEQFLSLNMAEGQVLVSKAN